MNGIALTLGEAIVGAIGSALVAALLVAIKRLVKMGHSIEDLSSANKRLTTVVVGVASLQDPQMESLDVLLGIAAGERVNGQVKLARKKLAAYKDEFKKTLVVNSCKEMEVNMEDEKE